MEEYFYEAFNGMQRLGPGSDESTMRALGYMDTTRPIQILDVGCGVGTHTFLLAKALSNAQIIAIDNNKDYIDILNARAVELGLADRVKGIVMSMFEMTFDNATFDYIYSEGAIYIAGFINGLRDWKHYLKPSGVIICSEISWITGTPSDEAKTFWESGYSQMDSLQNKIMQAQNLGYESVDYFILPKEDWTDNYYVPLQKNLDGMRKKYIDNETALEVVAMIEQEIDVYARYGNEYSYVFYVLRAN